ncbi:MAG: hypothetical protein HY758_05430 [Nitrospirae bacterium]|nr:hypothetical protein [Nitrospirota bacterium]
MLTLSELKKLASIKPDDNQYISLFLNVNPLTNPKGDYVIHFKNMFKELSEKTGRDADKKMKKAVEKIEAFLLGNKREFKKSIAIICSADLKIWREYNLSLPIKNELIADNTPYIQPLLSLLNNYPRCAVILVDKELAKIYLVHLGEIEEYTERFSPDIPGRHKRGDWFSLSQKRFEAALKMRL